jgi:CBS domain-containing protein
MRTIGDIMEPYVRWLPSDMPLARAAEELASHQISGAPVCEPDGTLVGVLSRADLVELYGGANEARLVRDAMTPELVAVTPDDRLAGIVTSMDVLRELAGFPRRRPRVYAVAPPP